MRHPLKHIQIHKRPGRNERTHALLVLPHDLLVIEEHPTGIGGVYIRDIVARVYRGGFVRDEHAQAARLTPQVVHSPCNLRLGVGSTARRRTPRPRSASVGECVSEWCEKKEGAHHHRGSRTCVCESPLGQHPDCSSFGSTAIAVSSLVEIYGKALRGAARFALVRALPGSSTGMSRCWRRLVRRLYICTSAA